MKAWRSGVGLRGIDHGRAQSKQHATDKEQSLQSRRTVCAVENGDPIADRQSIVDRIAKVDEQLAELDAQDAAQISPEVSPEVSQQPVQQVQPIEQAPAAPAQPAPEVAHGATPGAEALGVAQAALGAATAVLSLAAAMLEGHDEAMMTPLTEPEVPKTPTPDPKGGGIQWFAHSKTPPAPKAPRQATPSPQPPSISGP